MENEGNTESGARLAPGDRVGPSECFQISHLISIGRASQIYEAIDHKSGARCILKRLVIQPSWGAQTRAAAIQALANEGATLQALTTPGHPSIPQFYAYLSDLSCLVLQFIPGESLFSLLKRRVEPFKERLALRCARDVASALVYMHSRTPEPVMHLDIKLNNLMLDSTERTWLLDFGLARTFGELPYAQRDNYVGGTPYYMPPEQWKGRPEPRSDIYALTATLFFLLTNASPAALEQYQSPPSNQPMASTGLKAPTPLPPLSADVELLLRRGLASDVTERPQAQEFLAELEDLLSVR